MAGWGWATRTSRRWCLGRVRWRRRCGGPGGWGHALVDELGPADIAVEKVNFSAFYMSRLEWVLGRAGVRRLFVAGIVSNGGVASTVRDAHVREFEYCGVTVPRLTLCRPRGAALCIRW